MSDDDLSKKIISALSSSSSPINVKKLRKQILLQLQTDSDDKDAKKQFKRTVQKLESDGVLLLNKDGEMSLSMTQKVKSKEQKKEDKKNKKKKKEDKKKHKDIDVSSSTRKKKRDESFDVDVEKKDEASSSRLEKKQKVDGKSDTRDEVDDENENENENEDVNDKDERDALHKESSGEHASCPGNPTGCTRLFLGNLPFSVDEASLRTFLSPAEMTHVKWITDKETGKFYGSAFIEVATSKCGAVAVKKKNGEKLMGRPIRINFAPAREGDVWPPKSKEVTGNGGQAGGSGVKAMGVKPDNCVKLFIGNLSFDIDDDTIIKFFASVDAEVKAVRWLHHRDSGDFKGCGYVEFWNTEACEKGAALNGKSLMGRPIRIDWTD